MPDRPGHDRRYLLDSTKLRRELGWEPEIEFDDGIARHGRVVRREPRMVGAAARPRPGRGDGLERRPRLRRVALSPVRILVTGAGGQVGARVVETLGDHEVLGAAHDALDLADREQVEQVVAEFAPDAVVNAAAMTNVDALRTRPRAGVRGERARRAPPRGRGGPRAAPTSCTSPPTTCSTASATRPYDEWDAVAPALRVRPLEARRRASRSTAHARSWATVRTSWVFGRRGTDLVSWAFGAFDRGELDGVLADQVSIPTYAPDLAVLLARFAVERRQGLFHVTSGIEAVTRHELIVTALRARGLDPSRRADHRRSPTARPGARRSARSTTARCASPASRAAPLARRGHRVREGLGMSASQRRTREYARTEV